LSEKTHKITCKKGKERKGKGREGKGREEGKETIPKRSKMVYSIVFILGGLWAAISEKNLTADKTSSFVSSLEVSFCSNSAFSSNILSSWSCSEYILKI